MAVFLDPRTACSILKGDCMDGSHHLSDFPCGAIRVKACGLSLPVGPSVVPFWDYVLGF